MAVRATIYVPRYCEKNTDVVVSRINERDELAKRYLKFSLPHLVESAVGICQGAVCCMHIVAGNGAWTLADLMSRHQSFEAYRRLAQ